MKTRKAIRKALQIRGFRFFLIHAPCPTGWKTEPADTVELVRLAVRSGVFPLYEVFDGEDYRISVEPDGAEIGLVSDETYTQLKPNSGIRG